MTIKIIQWSSGNVGKGVLRTIALREELELVGLYVTSPDKCGRDAGEIAKTEPFGVLATNDVEVILNIDADVVIHTPLPSLVYGDEPATDIDNICKLLS